MKLLNKLKSDRKDLINNLNDNIEALEKIVLEKQAEIERLRNIVKADLLTAKEDFKLSLSDITKIRAEAIKEFWERLKLKKAAVDSWVVYVESGDNLVKEMVGDDNA